MRQLRLLSLAAPVLLALAVASPAAQAAPCSLPKQISGTVPLDGSCTYRDALVITASNTTVDCQGATFDGGGEIRTGLVINSRGEPLTGVTVRNCTFANFAGAGVFVGWQNKDSRKAGKEPGPAARQALYARHPSGVVLERVTVRDAGGVGVYIDDYVSDTLFKDGEVRGSTSTGFYLEHSSRRTTISGSLIVDNGHRTFRDDREGIAIDSSAHNRIIGNRFVDNGAGGIFLYRNCSEHFTEADQVRRWQGADHNEIRDNLFVNAPIGVWIASRQSRDLSAWGCGNAPMDGAGKFFEDQAEHNVVSGNRFCNSAIGVKVEDDNNTISDNRFASTDDKAVQVVRDAPLFTARGAAPTGMMVAGNTAGPEACAGVR